jgi:CBS domain-containing protein
MIIGPNSLLLDLATKVEGAIVVLEDAGIDYGAGRRTLAEGCERAGVAVETMVQRLAAGLAATPGEPCIDGGMDPSIERDRRPVTLPVHERDLLTADGRQRELSVFCPAQRASVELEGCRYCAFARRVSEVSVECAPKVAPRESSRPPTRIGESAAVGEAMGGHYVSVGPQVPAGVVVDALEARHAQAAVIVDDNDHLVGTVRRDGALTVQAGLVPGALARDTPYIDESASLADAIACMVKTHMRFLPVVGAQGRVVGLLADTDALRWVAAYNAIKKP